MHVVRKIYSVSVCSESFFKIFISSIIEKTFFGFMFNFTMEFINEYNDVVQKIQTVFSTSLHGYMLFEDGSRINLLVLSALSIQIRYSLHIRIKEKFDIFFFWSREKSLSCCLIDSVAFHMVNLRVSLDFSNQLIH